MKLDPRSIPYRGLQSAIRAAVGVGTVVLVGGSAFDLTVTGPIVLLAATTAGLAGMAWAVAYHRRFEFELTEESLDITSGVISRRTRRIPLRRIQNVDLREGVVPRLLGVAEVRFETAGGRGTEATLRFVDRTVARDLQERVDHLTEAPSEPTDEEGFEPSQPGGDLLYAIRPLELGLLSVTSIDWRALGFVALAAVGILPDVSGPGVETTPLAPLAMLAQPVLLTGAAILGNAALLTARFYGFELRRTQETLRYERGLFRRFSGSIPLERIHLLRLRDNPLTRRLGFAALDIETAGYDPGAEEGSAAAVPIAKRGRVLDLANSIEPVPAADFERPPARARRRYVIRYSAVALVVTLLLFGVDQLVRPIPWYLGLGLLVAAPIAAHLTWRHRGYVVGERALLVRAGFWRRTTAVVPFYRVQTVGTTATVFQRRWSLATVRIDTASGTPAAHDLDVRAARELRETVAADLLVDRYRRRAEGAAPSERWEAV